MRWPAILLLLSVMLAALPGRAATGRIIKVLPHLLDQEGRNSLSPSLYERDAYQAYLRQHTNQVSTIRFDIQWKAKGPVYAPLKLRIELLGAARGGLPGRLTVETEVKPGGWFSHWKPLALTPEQYQKFGEITAWRATLWDGNQLIGEQKSFLW